MKIQVQNKFQGHINSDVSHHWDRFCDLSVLQMGDRQQRLLREAGRSVQAGKDLQNINRDDFEQEADN